MYLITTFKLFVTIISKSYFKLFIKCVNIYKIVIQQNIKANITINYKPCIINTIIKSIKLSYSKNCVYVKKYGYAVKTITIIFYLSQNSIIKVLH